MQALDADKCMVKVVSLAGLSCEGLASETMVIDIIHGTGLETYHVSASSQCARAANPCYSYAHLERGCCVCSCGHDVVGLYRRNCQLYDHGKPINKTRAVDITGSVRSCSDSLASQTLSGRGSGQLEL